MLGSLYGGSSCLGSILGAPDVWKPHADQCCLLRFGGVLTSSSGHYMGV